MLECYDFAISGYCAAQIGRTFVSTEDQVSQILAAFGIFAVGYLMRPFGGFDHNAQSLRILTRLERRYAGFDGLNLTWETLEGLVKKDGAIDAFSNGLSASAKGLTAQQTLLERRLQDTEKRYRAQFSAMDALLAQYNNMSNFLTQQLAGLSGSSS